MHIQVTAPDNNGTTFVGWFNDDVSALFECFESVNFVVGEIGHAARLFQFKRMNLSATGVNVMVECRVLSSGRNPGGAFVSERGKNVGCSASVRFVVEKGAKTKSSKELFNVTESLEGVNVSGNRDERQTFREKRFFRIRKRQVMWNGDDRVVSVRIVLGDVGVSKGEIVCRWSGGVRVRKNER